jgi:hypothetical protein
MSANHTAANKAIDEYYTAALQGLLTSSNSYRDNRLLVEKAMGIARAAYKLRCDVLGITHAKAPD